MKTLKTAQIQRENILNLSKSLNYNYIIRKSGSLHNNIIETGAGQNRQGKYSNIKKGPSANLLFSV